MPRLFFSLLLLLISVSFVYAQNFDSLGIRYSVWRQLVPSPALPKEMRHIQHSNNNIDACAFAGKFYVAFRTAPTHFASKRTRLYVMSTRDFQTWEKETELHVGYDMREPRFLVKGSRLLFYFFEGGKRKFRFEPRHIWCLETVGNGNWTPKQNINLDGYVPWRFKMRGDTIYLSAYYGVNLYKNKHNADLRLFRSLDGLEFEPISKAPQVSTKGAEEGEIEFDAAGNLWATVRLEGSGAYVAYAPADSLHRWQTSFDRRKFDSALMFRRGEDFYVIARRHLRDGGYATAVEVPNKRQRRRNLLRYSFARKRTALYRLDKEKRVLVHLFDFPSHGDTAFPALAPIDERRYFLLNYSNKIGRGDKKWLWGQLGRTYIYATILEFDR